MNIFRILMGIFDKLFGSDSEGKEKVEKKALPWRRLTEIDQLNELADASHQRPQVIFKHSTRCGISSMVMNQFEGSFDIEEDAIDLYYLDLLSYREVSNEVAAKFQTWHESPQMLIIKNGETVHHASHSAIQASDILPFV
ncbi:bacillithiol system redox-active protein YtxJ [Sungkyunkwania multivorans]|uniref:Bacillithiol system redox-active protein YtxJ n=1 Tax=Sungkyunkwania multivorans TaxID=1173618 RepID=A0ABW3CY45_9FLAO